MSREGSESHDVERLEQAPGEVLCGISVGQADRLRQRLIPGARELREQLAHRARAIGRLAAIAGAVVGAWLGFYAADGMLALITCVVGAVAAANLALIAADVTTAEPAAAMPAKPAEARDLVPA